ncbi:MAG: NAD-dependent epimerase/dehydratase family protein [Filifactoraceae bacterium]
MDERILITGGNGFIGKKVCEKLKEKNLNYIVISRDNSNSLESQSVKVLDLLNKNELDLFIEEYKPNIIIHLAAIASPVHNDVLEVYRSNVIGTENLFESLTKYCKKDTRLIMASTAGVYGNQEVDELDEELKYSPVNHYSYSKMITEVMSQQYKNLLDIRIIRPFNIIGIGQNENFFISKLVKSFRNKEKVLYLGNMEAKRDYLSVEFCADVIFDLAMSKAKEPRVLNICTGRGYTCRDVVNILSEITGHYPEIISSTEFIRTNEVWNLVGNPTRLNSFIKHKYESESLEVILKKMLKV